MSPWSNSMSHFFSSSLTFGFLQRKGKSRRENKSIRVFFRTFRDRRRIWKVCSIDPTARCACNPKVLSWTGNRIAWRRKFLRTKIFFVRQSSSIRFSTGDATKFGNQHERRRLSGATIFLRRFTDQQWLSGIFDRDLITLKNEIVSFSKRTKKAKTNVVIIFNQTFFGSVAFSENASRTFV